MPEEVTLRAEVQIFAAALERRLRANERGENAKRGWHLMQVSSCIARADEERNELLIELDKAKPNLDKVRHEIEDTANFLLFAWFNSGDEFWRNK